MSTIFRLGTVFEAACYSGNLFGTLNGISYDAWTSERISVCVPFTAMGGSQWYFVQKKCSPLSERERERESVEFTVLKV